MFNALLIYISNDYKKVKQIETMLKKIAWSMKGSMIIMSDTTKMAKNDLIWKKWHINIIMNISIEAITFNQYF